MPTPRVAAIHDMSGFGRCSLTVAIPVLSAMGVQCCPLPTAYLSTHTGGFTGYTFLDMTDELPKTAAHWAELGIHFDAGEVAYVLICAGQLIKQGGFSAILVAHQGEHHFCFTSGKISICAASSSRSVSS